MRFWFSLLLITAISIFGFDGAFAGFVPPLFFDSVVAIGFRGPGVQNGVPVASMWHTIGTGFFYGQLAKTDQSDPDKHLYSTYLVTAKHVVNSYNNLKRQNIDLPALSIRINPTDFGFQRHRVRSVGRRRRPGRQLGR